MKKIVTLEWAYLGSYGPQSGMTVKYSNGIVICDGYSDSFPFVKEILCRGISKSDTVRFDIMKIEKGLEVEAVVEIVNYFKGIVFQYSSDFYGYLKDYTYYFVNDKDNGLFLYYTKQKLDKESMRAAVLDGKIPVIRGSKYQKVITKFVTMVNNC